MASGNTSEEPDAPPEFEPGFDTRFNSWLGVGLLMVPLLLLIVFWPMVYRWVGSIFSSDFLLGFSGFLLFAVGFVLLQLSFFRGWLRGSLDLPRPPRRAGRIAGLAVGLTMGLGTVLLIPCALALKSAHGVATNPEMERGFFLGIVAMLVAGFASFRLLTYRPASRNARLLAQDPTLVTAISGRRGVQTESVKVLYEPSAMVGPILAVTVDGKFRRTLRPGGALGMYLESGEHLVVLHYGAAGMGEPVRVRVTLAPGATTTILASGNPGVPVSIRSTPGEIEFRRQMPNRSSKFTIHPVSTPWKLGTPRPAAVHLEPEAVRDTSTLMTLPDPSAEALAGEPIRDDRAATTSTPAPSMGFGAPAGPKGPSADRHPWWTLTGVALGGAVAGGLLVALAGDHAPLLPLSEDTRAFAGVFGGAAVVHGGVVLERYRRAAFAPVRHHPGGLILVALAVFTANSPLFMPIPELPWPTFNFLIVFAVGAIAFLWGIGALRSGDSSLGFTRRQRAWAESPRLVAEVAGPAGAAATIRIRVNTLEATEMRFGLVGAASYPVSDRGPVGLRVTPGQRRIVVKHACGVLAEFEVTAVAGHITNVAVGRPAGRLLWIVPREQRLYARVAQPTPGDVEVASG